MSYDIELIGKEPLKTPLNKEIFDNLSPNISTKLTFINENGEVLDFHAKYKDSPSYYFEFEYQDEHVDIDKNGNEKIKKEGRYYSSIPYNRPPELYENFLSLVIDIAKKLNLNIWDLQEKEMPVDPFKYEKIYKKRLIERFASSYQYALKMAERSWILNWPADKTFFITYLIVTVDQKNNKNLFLSIKNNRLYASKVEKGEILSGVVKKELKSVFGIEEYKINNITDDGVAKDRYGNSLKRISLKIAVPYFDARRIKHPQYSFEWKEFKI